MDGLTIKNGRLINMRPDGMSGIEQASLHTHKMTRQHNSDTIADGLERAKMRAEGRHNFGMSNTIRSYMRI